MFIEAIGYEDPEWSDNKLILVPMETDEIGAIVMLLRNVNHKGGLCKETCLLITRLSDHVIEVKILTGTHAGNISYLP